MRVNHKAQPKLFKDLEATTPTLGVAILNKERFLEMLQESNTANNLTLLKNIKSEFLTYRGALL